MISNMGLEELPVNNFWPRLENALQKNLEIFLFNKTSEDDFIVKQEQKKKTTHKIKQTIYNFFGLSDDVQTSHVSAFSKL